MNNINETKIRGENNVFIYSRFLLLSVRFLLTVHYIQRVHLKALDDITRQYIEKWIKYPKHGVNDLVLYHPLSLDIKQPSQKYLEGHLATYINARENADDDVQDALDNKLVRESQWSNKYTTINEAHELYKASKKALNEHLDGLHIKKSVFHMKIQCYGPT